MQNDRGVKEGTNLVTRRPKVSVVVPVYGVEHLIRRCAVSLFSQTLREMEFIFVDDCTRDDSISILKETLEEFPQRKGQVRIFHHSENKGLPQARQTGLRHASGEYIAHCDSDDWVDVDMYRRLWEKAREESSDIVVCDYYYVVEGKARPRRGFKEGLDKKTMFMEYFSQDLPWNLWSKLVRGSLYKHAGIVPPVCTQGEDMALYLQLLYFSQSISYVASPLYYYDMNSATAMHVQTEEVVLRRFNQAVSNVKLLEDFFRGNRDYHEATDRLTYIKLSQREFLHPLMSERKYYELWKNTFPEINSDVLWHPYIKLRHKIKFILLYLRIIRK